MIKMSITDAELEKYRTYLEEGTMDAAAQKLNMTSGAISEAIRNVEKKINESIENIKIGLELELPFKRIKLEEVARKLNFVFDEEKEILQLPKSVTNDLKMLITLNKTDKTFDEFCIDAIKKEIQLVLSGVM